MGCNVSRGNPHEPSPKVANSNITSSTTSKKNSREESRSPEAKEISSIKNFKITHSDFISEKEGKIDQDYTLLSPPIGKGAYGEVRKAVHKKTNILRAVKIIYKDFADEEDQARLINEVNILRTLDHPNIMKIIEFYQDKKAFYIISEFYNGGELFEKISEMKNFSEKQAAVTIKQILGAVNYCHKNNIVHRDLKPENILYESRREDAPLKIIDFGTSKTYDSQTKMSQKFGTPYYIAPEVLRRKYTEKCDIWSCGVILYILLCGYPPFNGENDKIIMDKVATGKYDFKLPEWNGVSNEAKKFIQRMMEFDPTQRYSAHEALNDPWFRMILGENTIDKPLAVSALTNLQQFRVMNPYEFSYLALIGWKKTTGSHLGLSSELPLNKRGEKPTFSEFPDVGFEWCWKAFQRRIDYSNFEGYQKIMGLADVEAEVDAIMKAVDNNNSGSIDYTEFVTATINKQKLLSKEKLEAVFKMFDKDGSGYLTVDELKQIFNPGNSKEIDDKVWMELIKEVDENGDGKVNILF